jgi:pimeloyl-ACP methyl ester carboxylesterase
MGIEKTHLVGHHTGAIVAIEVALSNPARVDKLVLSACPYMDAEKRLAQEGKEFMDGDEEMEDGSHLVSLWQRRRAFYPKENGTDLLTRFMIDALLAGDNRIRGHEAVREYKLEEKFGRITQPTLLVVGTDDPYSYPEANLVAKKIKGSRTKEIIGGMVPLPNHKPKEFTEAILPFLLEN